MIKRNRKIALVLACLMMLGTGAPASAAGAQTSLNTAVAGVSLINDANSSNKAAAIDTAVAGIALNITAFNEKNTDKTVADAVEEAVAESEAAEKAAEEAAKPNPYQNIAITQVKNYVNIRSKASTEGEVVGKIYDKAAATILESVEGEDGEWYHIKSGSVEGYMKAEYFKTGEEAEAIAKKVGNVLCKTTAKTLRLREQASTESRTLMLLAEDSVYSVVEENITNEQGENFVKVLVSEGEKASENVEGYVATDYANVYVEFEEAISIEEELAEIARQEALKKAEEEAARAAKEKAAKEKAAKEAAKKEAEAKKAAEKAKAAKEAAKKDAKKKAEAEKAAKEAAKKKAEAEKAKEAAKKTSSSSSKSSSSSSETVKVSASGKGGAIAAKAQQYANNLRYVWGGTSLSSGADCSGFTLAIYKAYGISLPHSSSAQAKGGRSISKSELQPGDLVFYGSKIHHVAIYIGGGKICHEANSKRGCRIDSMTYCGSPSKYVTYTH